MAEKYILLNKKFLDVNFIKKYKSEAITIICYLLRYLTIRNEIIFNLDSIFDKLDISKDNKYHRNKIRDLLQTLSTDNVFLFDIEQNGVKKDITKVKNTTVIRATVNDDYIIGKKKDCKFVELYDYEFDKIVLTELQGIDNNLLLLTFLSIKSRINNETQICYPSFMDIKRDCNIKKDITISDNIKALSDLGVLIYKNAGHRVFKDKTVKQCNNTYALPEYEQWLDDAIDRYKAELEEHEIKVVEAKEANNRIRCSPLSRQNFC